MKLDICDPVTLKNPKTNEVYYYNNFKDFTDWIKRSFVIAMRNDEYLARWNPLWRRKYALFQKDYEQPIWSLYNIYNEEIPQGTILYFYDKIKPKPKYSGYETWWRKGSNHSLPRYRIDTIPGTKNWKAGGRMFRNFRHIQEHRELEAMENDEYCIEYNIRPRGKRKNRPSPWDDFKCEYWNNHNWKRFRKTQWK